MVFSGPVHDIQPALRARRPVPTPVIQPALPAELTDWTTRAGRAARCIRVRGIVAVAHDRMDVAVEHGHGGQLPRGPAIEGQARAAATGQVAGVTAPAIGRRRGVFPLSCTTFRVCRGQGPSLALMLQPAVPAALTDRTTRAGRAAWHSQVRSRPRQQCCWPTQGAYRRRARAAWSPPASSRCRGPGAGRRDRPTSGRR